MRYVLYIFWFLHQTTTLRRSTRRTVCCISFDSYIKPQLLLTIGRFQRVVYLLIPTSNHNCFDFADSSTRLYIFWFLHQTTTNRAKWRRSISCISFDSYIKPQLCFYALSALSVVYLLIPTSNHNCQEDIQTLIKLYIFWFLHQTTTCSRFIKPRKELYIFWFLHQTTTCLSQFCLFTRCISFDSYIKPQQWLVSYSLFLRCISFDSYIKPQLDNSTI